MKGGTRDGDVVVPAPCSCCPGWIVGPSIANPGQWWAMEPKCGDLNSGSCICRKFPTRAEAEAYADGAASVDEFLQGP